MSKHKVWAICVFGCVAFPSTLFFILVVLTDVLGY
jgi:hypothetical protein